MSVSPPPARSSLENLLLAQAVYQNGSQDWAFICSLLNGHPLTPYGDRIEGGWSEADAKATYASLMDRHPPPAVPEPDAGAAGVGGEVKDRLTFAPKHKATLWVAQVAYKARMADIKAEIQEEEEKFKALFTEMETLRALPTLDLPPPSPPPPPPPAPPAPAPKPIRSLPKPKPKPTPAPSAKASSSKPKPTAKPAASAAPKAPKVPNPNAPPRNPNWGPNTHPKKAMPPPGARWGPNTHPKKAMHKYITEPIGGGRSTSSGIAGVGKGKNLKPVKPLAGSAASPAPTTAGSKLAGQAKSIPFPPRKPGGAAGTSSAGGSVPPSPAPVASGSGGAKAAAASAPVTKRPKAKAQAVIKEAEAKRAEEAAKKAKERDERMEKKKAGGAAAAAPAVGAGRKRGRDGETK